MNALILALSLVAGQPAGPVDPGLEESARDAFRLGVSERENAAVARPHFARSAVEYRQLWDRGRRFAGLARAWARAAFLAGDPAEAIAAAQAGLRISANHGGLQRDLETYRDAVNSDSMAKPDERLRPARLAGVRSRLSGWDLFWLTAGASVLFGIGAASRFTTGRVWATPLAVLGIAGLLACGGLAVMSALDERDDLASPLWIVRVEQPLRKGNGDSHAPRIELPLPRGTEVREVSRRGGWVQVRVAGGAVGWLPERVLIPVP